VRFHDSRHRLGGQPFRPDGAALADRAKYRPFADSSRLEPCLEGLNWTRDGARDDRNYFAVWRRPRREGLALVPNFSVGNLARVWHCKCLIM
jgi:hypothetical protein